MLLKCTRTSRRAPITPALAGDSHATLAAFTLAIFQKETWALMSAGTAA